MQARYGDGHASLIAKRPDRQRPGLSHDSGHPAYRPSRQAGEPGGAGAGGAASRRSHEICTSMSGIPVQTQRFGGHHAPPCDGCPRHGVDDSAPLTACRQSLDTGPRESSACPDEDMMYALKPFNAYCAKQPGMGQGVSSHARGCCQGLNHNQGPQGGIRRGRGGATSQTPWPHSPSP